MLKGFVVGVLATVIVALVAGYVGLTQGLLIPPAADARPPRLERWLAGQALDNTIAREAPRQANPVAATDANYAAGIKLYQENCSACHGVPNQRPSTIAIGLYQHAPQLARHGVEDDDEGETFWKIQHGIRMTGMPSYGKSLTETQIWTLALFLKHMDALPPGPRKLWEAMKNPVAIAPLSALPSPPAGSTSTR